MSEVRTIKIQTQPAGAIASVLINRGPKGDDGIAWVISATAPTDTSVGWIDPESGIQSIYSGGGWVTQLIRTSADGAYVDENGNPYFSPTGTFYIAP